MRRTEARLRAFLPPPLLVVGLVGLALVLAPAWRAAPSPEASREAEEQAGAGVGVITVALGGEDRAVDDASVAAAPLFAPTRAPWRAPPRVAEEPPPPPEPEVAPEPIVEAPFAPPASLTPPDIVFVGFLASGGERRALVRGPEGEEAWVRVGDRIGEWGVAEMNQAGLLLEAGDQKVLVSLER